MAEQLNYTMHVMGIPLADATLNIDMTEAGYRSRLHFHTTGLAALVDSGRVDQTVSGTLSYERPAPQVYRSIGYLHGQNRVVDMMWQGGTPMVTAIAPPNAVEREDVPVALRAGTVDPNSLIVLLLHLADRTGRCEDAARSYDGHELQLFRIRTAGRGRNPGLQPVELCSDVPCAATSPARSLAGFRFGSGGEQDRRLRRGTIWLARVSDSGPPLPVRAAVETRWFGDATIYLTSVAQ